MATASLQHPPAEEFEAARMVCPECWGAKVLSGWIYGEWCADDCTKCQGSGHVSPDEQLVAMAEASEEPERWEDAAGPEWAGPVADGDLRCEDCNEAFTPYGMRSSRLRNKCLTCATEVAA